MTEKQSFQRFHVNEVARSFPDTAETLLLDTYLTDEEAASSRVFRVYRETPAHYHVGSDEYLYVLSGRGTFWMGDASNGAEFAPGDLLFFKRRVVHALPAILEGRLSCHRYAETRPERHHLCKSCRGHAGELRPCDRILTREEA
jgi:mannose-6-phosphate isomerase-like protein (cupin superfamily)